MNNIKVKVWLTKDQLVYLRDLVTDDYLRTRHYEGDISDKYQLIADTKTILLTGIRDIDLTGEHDDNDE